MLISGGRRRSKVSWGDFAQSLEALGEKSPKEQGGVWAALERRQGGLWGGLPFRP